MLYSINFRKRVDSVDKLFLSLLLLVSSIIGLVKSASSDKQGVTEIEEIVSERENISHENGYLYENDTLLVVFKEKVTETEMNEIADEYKAQIIMPMYDIGMCNFKFNIKMNLSELQQLLDNIKLEDKIEDVDCRWMDRI